MNKQQTNTWQIPCHLNSLILFEKKLVTNIMLQSNSMKMKNSMVQFDLRAHELTCFALNAACISCCDHSINNAVILRLWSSPSA